MSNTPEYNSQHYAHNKQRIAAQRRARRLAMSEQERGQARERQRQRSRKFAAKRRAQFSELLALANEANELLSIEGVVHDI